MRCVREHVHYTCRFEPEAMLVDEDPRIAIFRQARHGLAVRMALLCLVAPEQAAP